MHIFSCIWAKYGELFCKSPYSVRMRENVDLKNSEYKQFSRNENSQFFKNFLVSKFCGKKIEWNYLLPYETSMIMLFMKKQIRAKTRCVFLQKKLHQR